MKVATTLDFTNNSALVVIPDAQLADLEGLTLPAWVVLGGAQTQVVPLLAISLSQKQLTLASPYTGVTGSEACTVISEFTPRFGFALHSAQQPQSTQLRDLVYQMEALAVKYNPNAAPFTPDAPGPVYSAGCFNWLLSAGHAQLVGKGTSWLALKDKVASGLLFKRHGDTNVYRVASIEDDTHLTLDTSYVLPEPFDLLFYDADALIQPQTLIYYAGTLWRNLRSTTGFAEPPIQAFSLTASYRAGEYVFAEGSPDKFYRCIGAGLTTGVPVSSLAHWLPVSVDTISVADWEQADTATYQICSVLTPNLQLPVLHENTPDKLMWLRYIFKKVFAAVI